MVDRLTTVRAALDACDRFTRTGVVDHAMLTVYQAAPAIADLCREVERLQGVERGWRDALNKIESAQAARIATLEAERDQLRNAILHLSMAVDTDAVKAASVAEGWRLLAGATLVEVRKLAAARKPPTVGGLLATAPVGSIVEYHPIFAPASWWQSKCDDAGEVLTRLYLPRANGTTWTGWQSANVPPRVPARLVPADQADLDPSTRGPIGEG